MLPKSDWQHLIPHAGGMCLLDEVVAWDDAAIHARTRSHARDDNPLRSDGQLRALHLAEYGAQAMAIHGGLLARAQGAVAAPGYLVSLRDVELARRIGVPPWKLKDLSRQSRGWSAPGVARAIQHAAAADAAVKGASGDPDYALESLVLSVIDCRSRGRQASVQTRR